MFEHTGPGGGGGALDTTRLGSLTRGLSGAHPPSSELMAIAVAAIEADVLWIDDIRSRVPADLYAMLRSPRS